MDRECTLYVYISRVLLGFSSLELHYTQNTMYSGTHGPFIPMRK